MNTVTSLHSHSLVGSVHGCTSSTIPLARSGHKCAVLLAVPRGEFVVNTLAGVGVPIALSIELGCENPPACCAHAKSMGEEHSCKSIVVTGISISGLNIGYRFFE